MQCASNNSYIVQNIKTITFKILKVLNNDQKTLEVLNNDEGLGEMLTKFKSSNGVTRFHS